MFFDLLNPSPIGECAVQSLVLENGWKKADDPGKSFVLCGKKNPGTLVSEGMPLVFEITQLYTNLSCDDDDNNFLCDGLTL